MLDLSSIKEEKRKEEREVRSLGLCHIYFLCGSLVISCLAQIVSEVLNGFTVCLFMYAQIEEHNEIHTKLLFLSHMVDACCCTVLCVYWRIVIQPSLFTLYDVLIGSSVVTLSCPDWF